MGRWACFWFFIRQRQQEWPAETSRYRSGQSTGANRSRPTPNPYLPSSAAPGSWNPWKGDTPGFRAEVWIRLLGLDLSSVEGQLSDCRQVMYAFYASVSSLLKQEREYCFWNTKRKTKQQLRVTSDILSIQFAGARRSRGPRGKSRNLLYTFWYFVPLTFTQV